ncbi:MAG: hypothetical protein PHW64_01980 [Sulfuricurvum sp.]|nr:hypothetical protein [Sulfuricurvum sp.]
MKQPILFALICSALLFADELSFAETSAKASPKRSHVLQLASSVSLEHTAKALDKIPEKYRSGIAVYKIGNYFATRYIDIYDAAQLPPLIEDFKKMGFSSPISYKFNPDRIPLNLGKLSEKSSSPSDNPIPNTPPLPQTNPNTPALSLSEFDKTKLLIETQTAYKNHDYTQATIYHEMMVAAGFKERQILINLCYLYGRESSSAQMERAIASKRGTVDYLYAYGVGAIEANRSDLYTTLSPHLVYDKSGRLAMLCGYFFEKQNDPNRAKSFYKMAYDTNPSDPHIVYAYARSIDLSGNKDQAIFYYTQLAALGDSFDPIREASATRINQLRREL